MSRCKDPRSCKSQLRVWSTMIFHTVIILQLTDITGGESLTNSQYRMLAVIGHTQNATLPCSVTPATDVVDEMVEWSRSDMNPRFVHVRRSGEDRLVDQNPAYKERTSMSVDRLKLGDASLTLTKVRLSDEGTYRCFVPGLNTDFSVELVVEAEIKITKVSPGALECKSEGWYPEPKVFWLERERKLLSAGSKETFRGPDDLYTLSSRLTLEKGHSNNFTCRIQQNNQHREATIYVPDDFFMESSSSARSVIGGLIAGIMFIIVVSFLMWKWRKNKMENKKSAKDGESQSGREDNRCSSSINPEKESLMTNEENFKGGSEALMDQGKVKVNNPAYASEQPGLSSENSPAQITQSERLQNNDQQGRDTTNVMCSNEKTQSGDKKSALTEIETHPEPLDSNNEIPNHSLTDSSTQQQHIDTHKKNTQTISDETASQSPSEKEGKQETKEKNNPVEKKAIDGERPQTTNNETTDPLNRNVSQPSPTVGGQDNRGEDSGPNPNTQASHLEENRTIQETSGTTEQPVIEDDKPENNSPTGEGSMGADQQDHSTASKNAKSGPGDQNNDDNGERKQTTNNETVLPLVGNVSEPNSAVAEEAEEGQDNQEEDRLTNPDTPPSHLEENGIIQEDCGSAEQPKIEEDKLENNSPTDDGSMGADQQEHSTASKNAKSGPGDQSNDGNGERKQTTNNETADSLNRNVSQPNPAEGGQDNREEKKIEENRTIQEHFGTTEQSMIEENQPKNTSATGDGSVGADQQEHSTASKNAKSGPGDQSNDDNGERKQTTNNETIVPLVGNVSEPNFAVAEEAEEGQDNQEEDRVTNPDTPPSHLEENRTIQEDCGSAEQPKIEEKQLENNSPTGEGSMGEDQQEHSTESTDAKSGPGDQSNDGNGERKQTTNNETTVPLVGNVSEPNSVVAEEAEEGQDRGTNPDTPPSHLEENGTIQAPSGSTEQPKTEEKQSENTSATDDGSVGGEHSTKSTDANQEKPGSNVMYHPNNMEDLTGNDTMVDHGRGQQHKHSSM